jgi:hypothetical protein
MPIEIDDVEGLGEALDKLTDMNEDGVLRVGGELGTELEKIRMRLTKVERRLGIGEGTTTCIVCGRWVHLKRKSQPQLCDKHYMEHPKCPNCGNSGYNALTWSPQRTKATCGLCEKVYSGEEMQFRIAAHWAREYDE